VAAGELEGYGAALVCDFEQRREQPTRAPIANIAMLLERLAARCGGAVGLESRVLRAVAA
jgi:hypothetical protein